MKQLRGFKYRFYPTTEQKQLLAKQFGCARFWWNKRLTALGKRCDPGRVPRPRERAPRDARVIGGRMSSYETFT